MKKAAQKATLVITAFVWMLGTPFCIKAAESQNGFIHDVEESISKRQEALSAYPIEDTMSDAEMKENYEQWISPESEMIQNYEDTVFENTKFNYLAHMYMNGVNDQKAAVEYLPNYPALFNLEWSAGYNQRATSIVAFVDYYDMQLDESVYLEFVNAINNLNQPQYTVTFGDSNEDTSLENNGDQEISDETEENPIGNIKDLFADKAIAEFVREKLGKIDVTQAVTQGELNTITDMRIYSANDYGKVESLEGIAHLQNLEYLGLYNNCATELAVLPEELFTLEHLKELDVHSSSITDLPEAIGNLQKLDTLNVGWTAVSRLPDQIGNLTNLRSLIFSYTPVSQVPEGIGKLTNLETLEMQKTDVSVLPDTIGNCTSLKKLNISDTRITQLPESIYGLKLETFETKGLNLSGSDTDERPEEEPNNTKKDSQQSNESVSLDFYSSVNNDVTGKWRLAITSTDYPVKAYLRSYYKNYFKSDDEIHGIINTKDATTTCVAIRGAYLNVTTHQYVSGEEKDANLLFSGDVISDKWYDKDTGKEVNF